MGSMLSQVAVTAANKPPRIVLHGRGGVGKTSFAASAKSPVFFPCEDGAGILKVQAFPRPTEFSDAMACVNELLNEKHAFSTFVVDTIDGFEPLVWAETCSRGESGGKKSFDNIEDFGYGKGYQYADKPWLEFFHGLDALRENGMTVVILSHCTIQNIKDPQLGPYDRITPKLHKRANDLLYEWADIVGYLAVKSYAKTKGDEKSSKQVKTVTSAGERVLYLDDRGGFSAKNRFSLPAEIAIPKDEPFSALRNAIVDSIKESSNA